MTDGYGGTFWTSMNSSLTIVGGPIMNDLPSTINSFSTQNYYINSYFIGLSSISTDMYHAISSLSTAISLTVASNIGNLNGVTVTQLTSSMTGLGNLGWVSTSGVTNLISTANAEGQVSISSISTIASGLSTFGIYSIGTLNTINQSSFDGLGALGYVSSSTLLSTINSLGALGYISSSTLLSTINSLGTLGYVSSSSLLSTVNSLGTLGYISSSSLVSTLDGLGSLGYISAATLCNYITQGFSTLITTSTIIGLGSLGYVSTASLVSTVIGIQLRNPDIRFDTTTSVTTINGCNTFTNIGNIIYISTFLKSSIMYSGNNGTQMAGDWISPYDMQFSTASIDLTPFSPYINSNSRITLDIYPTIAFTKLATGATNVAVLPISSFLQQGNSTYYNTTTTSFLYAGNTRVQLEDGYSVDSSNIFNTPISIQIPPGTVSSFINPYNLIHYMPNSINRGGYQNALHSTILTPYFGNTGSIFVSVQNIA